MMKLSLFSNYLNAHQVPLCDELAKTDGVDFTFVSLCDTEGCTGRMSMDRERPYVVRAYERGGTEEATLHARRDDAVVFGDLQDHERYIRMRALTGLPFYRQAERLLKRGYWWRLLPMKAYRTHDRFVKYAKRGMHVLCSSAYTSYDLSLSGFPSGLCLKWGYFPDLATDLCRTGGTSAGEGERTDGDVLRIGSAQRLVPWKHTEMQIECASRLRGSRISFHLNIAGDGPERSTLEHLAEDFGVREDVSFLGDLGPSDMRKHLVGTDVLLLTSDRNEGWGAVVNESMAAGCVPLISSAVGSAPFLIDPWHNGLVFSDGDVEDLTDKVRVLGVNHPLTHALQLNARATVRDLWSAHVAANRLVAHAQSLMKNEQPKAYRDGPMSLASPLYDYDFSRQVRGTSANHA